MPATPFLLLPLCLLLAAAPDAAAEAPAGLAAAERALADGDIRSAMIALDDVIHDDPGNAEARRRLALLHLRSGDPAAAERQLRAARGAGLDEAAAAAPLAQALVRQNRLDEVLTAVPAGRRPADIEGQVRLWHGYAHAARRDLDAAVAAFRASADHLPDDPRPRIGLAKALAARGDRSAAEHAADRAAALARQPGFRAEALALKGDLRRLAGDDEAAGRLFAEALLTDPETPLAMTGQAALLLRRGDFEGAMAAARRALALEPGHGVATYLLAAAQVAAEHFDAARATLDAAHGDYPPLLLLRASLALAQGDFATTAGDLETYRGRVGDDLRGRRLLGALLLRQGDAAAAVAALEPAAAATPGDMRIAAFLAAAHLQAGDAIAAARGLERAVAAEAPPPESMDKAIDALREAVRADPAALPARLLLLLAHLRAGEHPAALRAIDALAERLPGHPLPPHLAGTVHLARGDTAAARDAFAEAIRKGGEFAPTLEALARLEARPEAALALLARAVAAEPAAAEPRLSRIELLLRLGEAAGAVTEAAELLEVAPTRAAAHEALAKAHWAAGQRPQAIGVLERLTGLMPDSARAGMLLANARAAVGDRDGALEASRAAVAANPTSVPALAQRLRLLVGDGRGATAVTEAEAWHHRHPENPLGAALLAEVHLHLGQPEQAVPVLAAMQARQPSGALLLRLTEARVHAGQLEPAADALTAWLAGHPDDTAARSALGGVRLRQGRHDQALAAYETVMRAEADNAAVLNNVAWLYERTGDPRALGLAERAHALDPASPAIADTLGIILVRHAQLRRGLELLRRAHRGAPDSPAIRDHLAEALAAAGHHDEARRLLEGDADPDHAEELAVAPADDRPTTPPGTTVEAP